MYKNTIIYSRDKFFPICEDQYYVEFKRESESQYWSQISLAQGK